MKSAHFFKLCGAALLSVAGYGAAADLKTISKEFIIDRPTLISLGFAWKIEGDANRNAKVEVVYRKKGDAQWRKGMPLFRSQSEKLGQPPPGYGAYATDSAKGPAPNAFAGSIFNLDPDTTYEARLALSDPDGVAGEKVKTVTVHTRPEPQPAKAGHVYHVYAPGYQGPKQEPAFLGLLSAYNMGASPSDHTDAYYTNARAKREFKTLEEYSKATGQDTHSILVDYDIFVKASMPDRSDPSRIYKPEEFDFRLKPGSKAVDAGAVLPNINDEFNGQAPDLGAYETDKPIPNYGPRPVPPAGS